MNKIKFTKPRKFTKIRVQDIENLLYMRYKCPHTNANNNFFLYLGDDCPILSYIFSFRRMCIVSTTKIMQTTNSNNKNRQITNKPPHFDYMLNVIGRP